MRFRETRQTSAAFTLVELLIVVAILVILAAVAIPNLQEAQVRSKVSRAKADMRTIALAQEMYRVDTNKYPPENFITPLNRQIDSIVCTPNILKLARLTTPVAYMTSVPTDPFAIHGDIANSIPPYVYHYASRNDPVNPDLWWWDFGPGAGKEWILQSNGPDRTPITFQYPEYDATNGTVSTGNILRVRA